ncbi:MAG TPA: ATP-binding protein, partial [Thermoanaerobaculia bacterium]|nr:ATP-binding protein [Thermoanaerobaculia bacterium]
MIERLSIRNFKVLREVDVELKPLTVIVGPNGSGKSTILQSISLLTDYLHRLSSSQNPSMEVFNHTFFERFRESLPPREVLRGINVELSARFGRAGIKVHEDLTITTNLSSRESWKDLGRAFTLDLDLKKLSTPSYPESTATSLPGDGQGIASVLATLYLEDPESFRQLVEQFKNIIPTVNDIRFRRARFEGKIGFEMLFDTKAANAIPAPDI